MSLTAKLRKVSIKFRKISINKFESALNLLPEFDGIGLIDIGAAGDIEPRWKSFEKKLHYVGFEPDEKSRNELVNRENSCLGYKIFPFALGNRITESEFYSCENPGVSSIFKPNMDFLRYFPKSNRFNILFEEKVSLKKLDDIKVDRIDFIKIDTQGSELEILQGSPLALSKVLGLEVEVEFSRLYLEQPLFGDICAYLEKFDLDFIDFTNLCRWERSEHNGLGQCVFGDALFLQKPERILLEGSLGRVSSYLACLLIYQRFDLIRTTLSQLPDPFKKDFIRFEKRIRKLNKRFKLIHHLGKYFNVLHYIFNINSRTHLIY
jgi:FkbM family methyltransferase